MKDINRLILASHEIGLKDHFFRKNVANITKCQTWQDVLDSHKLEKGDVTFTVRNAVGLLYLLTLGLSAGLFVFIAENLVYWHSQARSKKETVKEETGMKKISAEQQVERGYLVVSLISLFILDICVYAYILQL